MTEKFIDEIIVVPGDHNGQQYTCITSDSRPDPAHCWIRAGMHCYREKTFAYFVQVEAATTCRHMFEAAMKIPRPPQKAPPLFGWGKAIT